MSETGSTLMYPLCNLWAGGYSQKYPPVTIQTAGDRFGHRYLPTPPTGPPTSAPRTPTSRRADVHGDPDLLNIPLAISAQLIAYNVPGVTAHLKLTGKILARDLSGQDHHVERLGHPAAEPGVTLPAIPIVTLHRSDSSGDTFLFTQFLNDADAGGWGKPIGFNTTSRWPNAPGALGEIGNSGMVSGCKATPGCVAYVGISYLTQALQAGLGYAQLQNGQGQYVLPTPPPLPRKPQRFTKKTPANGTISLIDGKAEGRLPDRELRVRHRELDPAVELQSTAKDIRSLLEWASTRATGTAPSTSAR